MDSEDKVYLNVTDENKENISLEVIDFIEDTPFDKEYIVYKKPNDEQIYTSILTKLNTNYKLEPITSEEELFYVNSKLEINSEE